MSVRMMVEVIDRAPRGLPDVQHRALIAIAERMNDRTRTGYHPLDELAHRISRSRPTATRTLRALTDLGLLKVVKPAGRGRSTVYYMPPLASAEAPDAGDALSDESTGEPGKVITQMMTFQARTAPKRSSLKTITFRPMATRKGHHLSRKGHHRTRKGHHLTPKR